MLILFGFNFIIKELKKPQRREERRGKRYREIDVFICKSEQLNTKITL